MWTFIESIPGTVAGRPKAIGYIFFFIPYTAAPLLFRPLPVHFGEGVIRCLCPHILSLACSHCGHACFSQLATCKRVCNSSSLSKTPPQRRGLMPFLSLQATWPRGAHTQDENARVRFSTHPLLVYRLGIQMLIQGPGSLQTNRSTLPELTSGSSFSKLSF